MTRFVDPQVVNAKSDMDRPNPEAFQPPNESGLDNSQTGF